MNIIVFEDEDFFIESFEETLNELGHEVLATYSHFREDKELLKIEQKLHRIDAFLIDIGLIDGSMSGFRVAKYAQKKHIPFILITEQDDERLPTDLKFHKEANLRFDRPIFLNKVVYEDYPEKTLASALQSVELAMPNIIINTHKFNARELLWVHSKGGIMTYKLTLGIVRECTNLTLDDFVVRGRNCYFKTYYKMGHNYVINLAHIKSFCKDYLENTAKEKNKYNYIPCFNEDKIPQG